MYVIDVRRVRSQRRGYCYGSRIMYVDTQFMHQLWEEILNDANLKLWKLVSIHLHPAEMESQARAQYPSMARSSRATGTYSTTT